MTGAFQSRFESIVFPTAQAIASATTAGRAGGGDVINVGGRLARAATG